MKNKLLFIFSLLLALMFINAGLNKIFNYMAVPTDMSGELMKDFGAMVEIAWLMPLVAVAEIVGGLLLIFPKTRALGAVIITPVMMGILLSNFTVTPTVEGMAISAVLALILVWILIENRHKYLPMLKA